MSVFNALYAGQYDEMYAEKNYSAECDLVEAAVARFGGGRKPRTLLDIGCGTGAHSLEFARRGYTVTGVDLSPQMLERATAKAGALGASARPQFVQGDARNFEVKGPFDVAIMMFAVVGYLTGNDDVLAGLRNARRYLAPGSLFVCDFWYGPSVIAVKPSERIRVIPNSKGRTIRAAGTTLDITQHTADVTFRLWSLQGDRLLDESTETHRMRYFFPQEFALLLKVAGFEQVSLSAFPTLDAPLTDQTWNALSVARAI